MSFPNVLLDTVSFISKVSQSEFDTRTADNMISWAGLSLDYGKGTLAGYWCHVHSDEEGSVTKIEVLEDYVFWKGNPFSDPHDLVYLIMGWATYHKIEIKLC